MTGSIRLSLLFLEARKKIEEKIEDWVERQDGIAVPPGFDAGDLTRLKLSGLCADYARVASGAALGGMASSLSALAVRHSFLRGFPLVPPPADIPLEGLYGLLSKPHIDKVYVLFHAEWCEPCKGFKTVEYQNKIKAFNTDNPRTPIVMVALEEGQPETNLFAEEVVAQSIVVNDRVTGESSVMKRPVLPALITIDARTNRYLFRSVNDVKANRVGPAYFADLASSVSPEERNESLDGSKEYVFIDAGWQDLMSYDELKKRSGR